MLIGESFRPDDQGGALGSTNFALSIKFIDRIDHQIDRDRARKSAQELVETYQISRSRSYCEIIGRGEKGDKRSTKCKPKPPR